MNKRQLVIFISTCVLLLVLCVHVDAGFKEQLEQFKCASTDQGYAKSGKANLNYLLGLGKRRDNLCLWAKLHNKHFCKPEFKECCDRAVKFICCLDGYGKDEVEDPIDTTYHCPTNMDLIDELTDAFKDLPIKCAQWSAHFDLRRRDLACDEFGNPKKDFTQKIKEECSPDEIYKIGDAICKVQGSKVWGGYVGESSGGITVSGLVSLKAAMICLVNLIIYS